jgi:beta-lactamase superfamily II metal-dependent hydrolase
MRTYGLFSSLVGIFTLLVPLSFPQQLQVHCIDVGQGSSELVIGPNGTSILIDGGKNDAGYSDVVPYLNTIFPAGSRHLSYVIASHDDSDHYGGLDAVLDSGYTAGTIYHCGENYGFGKGVKIPLGVVIDLGSGAHATCVGRYGAFIDGSQGGTSDNNQSICLLIEYGGFDYITAGDLESNESILSSALIGYPPAKPYLDPAYGVDVIHVNHHGSDSSSSSSYVNDLKHNLAVINGGTNFGHPRWTAVDRLKGRLTYSDGSGATYVTWAGCTSVFRTTYDIVEDGRAPEYDCPTLGDMVITYSLGSRNYYLNSTAYPVDEVVASPTPVVLMPTPTPAVHIPTPTPLPIILASGDYNGDGTSELAVYRSASGMWAIRNLTNIYFGSPSDYPSSGDFDGDGTTDATIFRPSQGLWGVRNITRVIFGVSGDRPVPEDYDGDGRTDIGVFRSSKSQWAIFNLTRWYFGSSTDLPVPGDYNGDGTADTALFRKAAGMWAVNQITRIYFGSESDIPVPADYNGDSRTECAVYRPAFGYWLVKDYTRLCFGGNTYLPRPGDYDGNSHDDPGAFRPSTGLWIVPGLTRTFFGTAGDIPVTR